MNKFITEQLNAGIPDFINSQEQFDAIKDTFTTPIILPDALTAKYTDLTLKRLKQVSTIKAPTLSLAAPTQYDLSGLDSTTPPTPLKSVTFSDAHAVSLPDTAPTPAFVSLTDTAPTAPTVTVNDPILPVKEDPGDNHNAKPPVDNHNEKPPVDNHNEKPPVDNHNNKPPVKENSQTPTGSSSVAAPTASGASTVTTAAMTTPSTVTNETVSAIADAQKETMQNPKTGETSSPFAGVAAALLAVGSALTIGLFRRRPKK